MLESADLLIANDSCTVSNDSLGPEGRRAKSPKNTPWKDTDAAELVRRTDFRRSNSWFTCAPVEEGAPAYLREFLLDVRVDVPSQEFRAE